MNNNNLDLRGVKARAPRYKKIINRNVYDMALERINHIFDLFDHVYVSFSGGKDSTVVLNLVLQVARERNRLPLSVVHYDEEAIPIDVEDYVRRISKIKDIALEWYCVPLKHRNACHPDFPYWYPWAPEDKKKWCRLMPPEALTSIGKYTGKKEADRLAIPELDAYIIEKQVKAGYRVCTIMGIRADESMTRYRAVTNRMEDNYLTPSGGGYGGSEAKRITGAYKGYPIYDWTTTDVWTAPNKFGWDYCAYYDLLEMAKVPRSGQRLAPPYGEEPFQRLWLYAKTYPELWQKMCERVPGANTASLYSSTGLYGFRELPEKPKGMSWEKFIAKIIKENHTPEKQKIIVDRLTKMIARHYRTTTDPIIAKVVHPKSGIGWDLILQIALRGDFKNRKQEMAVSEKDKVAFDKAYEKYLKAKEEQGL